MANDEKQLDRPPTSGGGSGVLRDHGYGYLAEDKRRQEAQERSENLGFKIVSGKGYDTAAILAEQREINRDQTEFLIGIGSFYNTITQSWEAALVRAHQEVERAKRLLKIRAAPLTLDHSNIMQARFALDVEVLALKRVQAEISDLEPLVEKAIAQAPQLEESTKATIEVLRKSKAPELEYEFSFALGLFRATAEKAEGTKNFLDEYKPKLEPVLAVAGKAISELEAALARINAQQ